MTALPAPTSSAAPTGLPVLVVDLDGTLVANDLLLETGSRFVSQHPLQARRLLRWLVRGKAVLKRELWAAAPVRVEHLRYHPDLLSWLEQERARGRTLVLATAADHGAARAIADHLGIFDDVLASDGATNLGGAAKAAALVDRYGEGGFEYVGNHRDDLAVWRHAAAAHVVGSRRLDARARRATRAGRRFAAPHDDWRPWWSALRPHQWVKNLLVLVPLLASHQVTSPAAVLASLAAFAGFCLTASSVYLLNDIADVENDRSHPSKRHRPFAAGTADLALGWLLWPALAVAGVGIGLLVRWQLAVVLVVYLVTTAAYSFALKRKPVIDVLTLASLYTVRLVAGAAAIDVALSKWMLSFSVFFFLSLALVKRVSELQNRRLTGGDAHGRGYRVDDLELLSSLGVTTSVTSTLVFTLFVNDRATADLYAAPSILWASVPVLLAWLLRVWLLAHRGEMNEDPILFAIRDRLSVVCGGLILLPFVLATLWPA